MEKYQFKPFEQVLVRDSDEHPWRCEIFSNYRIGEVYKYGCIGSICIQCIPYNENTAHLLNTCKPYEEPKPKVWKVTCHKNNEVFHFTNDEYKHFIKTAVVNNKDIQWFTTTYDEKQ